jgi:hypothetical protein
MRVFEQSQTHREKSTGRRKMRIKWKYLFACLFVTALVGVQQGQDGQAGSGWLMEGLALSGIVSGMER